ncbi:7-carboxy-7-deazaguanine synthase QueE [Bacillus coahuilensis]|uniref:7-carboxy-7-deazaguanine synthase QueE n=1 Tax=Bacillus coahuilensis TaxID=408580 RepID=UPI000ACD5500|nr:7-carboxy-7-deazaguanine synthase QueE [Bacillus coahuilensis]
MRLNKFPVLEIFGPTVQGEGMVIGQKTMFIRTAGCDYSCSWCDSSFTWDGSAKEDIRLLSADEIWSELVQVGGDCFNHVTISGGNPALLKHLNELLDVFHNHGIQSALETQGSRWQDWFLDIDDLTLSPKPPSSGMTTDFSLLDSIIQKLLVNNKAFSLKVVIFDELDLSYATLVHKRYPQVDLYLQTGNPEITEGDDNKLLSILIERYAWLINEVMKSSILKNVRVLPQLHTYVWGNKRGV